MQPVTYNPKYDEPMPDAYVTVMTPPGSIKCPLPTIPEETPISLLPEVTISRSRAVSDITLIATHILGDGDVAQ